jgi:hypothetical protein
MDGDLPTPSTINFLLSTLCTGQLQVEAVLDGEFVNV